jgi:hypothetical protein
MRYDASSFFLIFVARHSYSSNVENNILINCSPIATVFIIECHYPTVVLKIQVHGGKLRKKQSIIQV